MTTEEKKLFDTVKRVRDHVVADGRIDIEETEVLLALAKRYEEANAELKEFAELIVDVRQDGIVTREESDKFIYYLDWLSRELYAAEPETGFFGKFFKLNASRTTFRTELVAGLTTFMTMAYILAVNPNLLSIAGIPRGGVFVATCLAAFIGTVLMALMSNYPFALAPGMGLNAFLTFGVCLGMGYSWQFALLAVFVEGLVFLALSLTPVREAIFNCIPFTLKKAVAAGIGLFICFIALQCAKIIVNNDAVLVGLVSFKNVAFATQGICALLAIVGTVLTGVMMAKNIKGAILYGIFVTWGLGMLCQAAGLYVPDAAAGYFSLYPTLTFAGISDSFAQFGQTLGAIFNAEGWTHTVKGADGTAKVVGSGFNLITSLDFFVVMFAFFFVDLFDTLGTLIGVSMKGGFLTKEGKLPRISGALCADAIATSVGAVFGTSTTTTYVESASGVMVGGRTGLTGMTTAILFLVSLVLAPVFLAVPAFATAPALITVGYLMLSSIAEVDFRDPSEAIPAFLTVAIMPFAYSISDGIMAGVISYTLINLIAGRAKKVHWIMYVLTALFVAKYALM